MQNGVSPPRPASGLRKRRHWIILLVILILVALGVRSFLSEHHDFEWGRFAATFSGLDWWWILLAAGLSILSYYGRALRWAVMMRPVCAKPSVWNIFTSTAIGFTAVVLLGRPAEFVRPFLIASRHQVPFSSQLAAWLLERIYDLLVVLVLFGIGLTRVEQSAAHVGPQLRWVLTVGGNVVGIAGSMALVILFVLRQFSEPMRKRLLEGLAFLPAHFYGKAEGIVNAFVQGVGSTKSHSSLFLLIFYTAVEWVLIIACYIAMLRAFPDLAGFTVTDTIIFLGFVSFGSLVQIPGVGGGIQIVAVLVLTDLFQLPVEVATGIALMVWIITFVAIVPFGLIIAFVEGITWKKLRAMEQLEAGYPI